MNRGRAVLAAALVVAVAMAGPLTGPAAANHDVQQDQLWVTIAINAAGEDRISVTDDTVDATRTWAPLASDVAVALGRPAGSFRPVEDFDAAHVVLRDKLATPDGRGGLGYAIDTGDLQLLAQREGYEVLLLKVCTPRVHQLVRALVAPEVLPFESPARRCRGWYQAVEEPAIRAVMQLAPDRERYPSAVRRVIGSAAIAFGLVGIGATLLRRGPMRRRSLASWLVGTGAGVVVLAAGWTATSVVLWWTGATADPVLLGGGSVGEQVARTLLPGLAFLLPALLPAALLLTVPRRERAARPPSAPAAAAGPPPTTWWPTAWWGRWAAQVAAGTASAPAPAAPTATPPPPPADGPPPPPGDGSGWAVPGSGGG